jgi:hypothetical protein
MQSYDHDQWFELMDTQGEGIKDQFAKLVAQLRHAKLEELTSNDHVIERKHFLKVSLGSNDSTPVYVCIDIHYFVKKRGTMGFSLERIRVFDDENQQNLYKSMESTITDNVRTQQN